MSIRGTWYIRGEATNFLENDLDIDYGRFSPDGRWLTYELGPAGRSQVMIRRFPGGESPLQISARGQKPVWRPDGKAVLFSDATAHIVEVEVDLDNLTVGKETRRTSASTIGFGAFDVNPVDGRILIIADESARDSGTVDLAGSTFDVVVHWTGTLPEAKE